MENVAVPGNRLSALVEDVLTTPLDEIPVDTTKVIVSGVLKRGTIQAPVEVARFGSAI
jgi:hypothetical protein